MGELSGFALNLMLLSVSSVRNFSLKNPNFLNVFLTLGGIELVLSQSCKRSMAWRSHGSTNEELITKLRANGVISSDKVEQVMKSVDRGDFCKHNPYSDSPQGIGYGVTISAPHMHAYALELLKDQLKEGNKALDVGSGSGYLTVCFAKMVGNKGSVLGIDHVKELVDWSESNVQKNHGDLLPKWQN